MIRYILITALCFATSISTAQSAADAFDVISIKETRPAPPFSVGSVNPPHSSKFRASNYTAMILIQVAYGVTSQQVSGAPDWLRDTRFEIQAQSDASVDDRLKGLSDEEAELEKRRMLQSLLMDRFKLRVHTASRNLPAYVLVVAKTGPKLLKSKGEPVDASLLNAPKTHPIAEHVSTNGHDYVAQGASMDLLAAHLTGLVGATVLDKTGLAGRYDFTLESSGLNAQPDSTWPSVFVALTEQLGLKLQFIRGPVPDLVIDHIEKPSEN
jgi:uncharacterized protein (TIGR03435 family)